MLLRLFSSSAPFSSSSSSSAAAAATSLGQATRAGAECVELVLRPDPAGGPTDLTCMNIMCEHVGGACVCRLARALSRLPCLERLDIAGHRLGMLPDNIGELPNLTHLDVSGNDLGDLSMLERPPPKRDVWGREIVVAKSGGGGGDDDDGGEGGFLEKLVSLKADDNRLTSLDLRRLTALKEVSLRNNAFEVPPRLPMGAVVGLDGNPIAIAGGAGEEEQGATRGKRHSVPLGDEQAGREDLAETARN